MRMRKRSATRRRVIRKNLQAAEHVKPYHHVSASGFSFSTVMGYKYADIHPVSGYKQLIPITMDHPHFLLQDQSGVTRVALGYVHNRNDLHINSIQRVRSPSAYTQEKGRIDYSLQMEQEHYRQLRKELGNIHPSEFILAEFIFRHRRDILSGMNVFLSPVATSDSFQKKLYTPLIERFFGRQTAHGFPLNLSKKRVRQLLGLTPPVNS
ncbi:MAG: hypothetical protein IPJ89_03560 [Candidatus Iainarchaeum archaeon]|uniref:Uncharacterized protein n=1 Tax=Candidatus Iainarchaeum sp. TaxID=3101447 RepID=A0A7T9I1D1_9ARCH|nr:MAG: hypothetical protein IPJ89_03560 [Candidatus Diapherotrites archaeon]